MSEKLYTQVDFARKLGEALGKSVSKQNISYYKKQGMLCTVSGVIVKTPGDSQFLSGDAISKKVFDDENGKIQANGGVIATGKATLLVDYERSVKLLNRKIDSSHSSNFSGASTSSSKPAGSASEYDYNVARARNEHFKSELSRMEVEEKAKSLTSASEVENEAYTCAARVRDTFIEDLPSQLAPILALMTDEDKIEEFLRAENTKALKSLSQEISKVREESAS